MERIHYRISTSMKKIVKWVVIILLIPPLLFLILTVLLYLPPIQNWVAGHVADYASRQLDMDISVGHVSLKFPLDLQIDDFQAIKANDSINGLTDTIAKVDKLVAKVQFKPLLKKQVEIDALQLSNAIVNTDGLIPDTRVKGRVGNLNLQCHGVDLNKQTLRVDEAILDDADIDVALGDSVPPDTTETENFWKIYADKLRVSNSKVAVHMPGDSLSVAADISLLTASNGAFDLGEGKYTVAQLDLKGNSAKYNKNFEKAVEGLDTNHLHFSGIDIGLDSVSYQQPHLDVKVRHCALQEKSGIQIEDLTGRVALDSTRLAVNNLNLKTPDSHIKADVQMDLDAFDEKHPGVLYTDINATIGKQDMLRFMGNLPEKARRSWPAQPMMVSGKLRGNLNHADFEGLHVDWPSTLTMHANGHVDNLSHPNNLNAAVRLKGKTGNLDFLPSMLGPDVEQNVRIPRGMALEGDIKAQGKKYGANLNIAEGNGKIKTVVDFDSKLMAYNARIDADKFAVGHFVKNIPAGPLTAHIEAKGQGTDFLSKNTTLQAKALIADFKYDKWQLNGVRAEASMKNGLVNADVESHNALLDGHVAFNAALSNKKLDGNFDFDLNNADLYSMRVADTPLTIAGIGNLDIHSDLKENHSVRGRVSNLSLTYNNALYQPDEIELDVLTRTDTTYAYVDCGDFHLNMNGQGGYKRLLKQVEKLSDEMSAQIKEKRIDEQQLKDLLPNMNLYLKTGKDNFFADILEETGYSFQNVLIDLTSSPHDGLNGSFSVDSLVAEGYQLDTVRLNVLTDERGIRYNGQVRNNADNPQYVFNALLEGGISGGNAYLHPKVYDKNDVLGLDLGLKAAMEQEGIRLQLIDTAPIIGFIPFKANDDNFIFMANDKRLSANLDLMAEDKTRLYVYTNDDNLNALQDLTVSVDHFDLDRIMSILPYLPDVKGIANGDFHIIQTTNDLSVSGDFGVDKLVYEGNKMGDLSTEFVYMPNDDGSHYIDGILYFEKEEVGTLVGSYYPDNGGRIDADFTLSRTPLSLVNGFIPDQLLGFKGYATGAMSIKGPLSNPAVNGTITPDSAYVFSSPYGIEMRMEEQDLKIVGNHLNFENYKFYAPNSNPLTINGSLDFSQLDRMFLDLRMSARDFLLVNSKEMPNSEAYGKAYVNFFSRINGPLDALTMRGKLDLLGSTNMTYVLRDSPLAMDNRLNELVVFTNFNDSTEQIVKRPPINGFTMDLSMSIDNAAQIKCDLNAEHSNYIDLIGGGELRMQYNSIDNLRLTGRYTLSNGEMKYSLPIIPLKTFSIQDGSYIEFTGDPMNPRLHITALEKTKATVADEGGGTRSVDFNCGVVLSQTLNDMGLEFVVDATDDMIISGELASMSKEERGKVAVTMLTTGMYLADGNTSGFTMNGALSSFLQNEINNITGNALRSLNFSVGVDNATDATGNMHTDYSFKFAKRFWNNRLSISVGGKVSTGSEVEEQNQSFFNNVTFEYRLSPTSNKYLKLYYNRDSYDWLEGDVGEYGGGFLWRRKIDHFSDLFKWNNTTPVMPRPQSQTMPKPEAAREDSLQTQKNDE